MTAMNTQPLHEKLRLAAHIVEHELPWEYSAETPHVWTQAVQAPPTDAIVRGWEIRLADGWLPHYGGERPCNGDQEVQYICRDGEPDLQCIAADMLRWNHAGTLGDVIAWRPAKTETPPAPFDLRAHVKQSFPGLRDAHIFHRDDFTADDLPPGYRPMLLGERGDYECYLGGAKWVIGHWPKGKTVARQEKNRTTRPLPVLSPQEVADGWIEWRGGDCPVEPESRPEILLRKGETVCRQFAGDWIWRHTGYDRDIIAYKPDPYGKFRQAIADGKKVETLAVDGQWYQHAVMKFDSAPDRYRIAPEKKRVKLGPEDVPPFSVVRRKPEQNNGQQWHWRCVSYVHGIGVQCGDRGYEWEELQNDYQINRSIPLTGKWDATAWEPCYKEVEV